ncbi:hypothetical protein C0995_013033 [Termitomyces sp. Mi166|nr:hypothetical protein C0995_013033 [Termitomyces sp. Mi166\
MAASIRRVHQPRTQSAKLQAAQQKADIAIQQLRQSGDQDVADVLITRYEELKQRHDRLLKLQEATSIQGPLTTSTEEEEVRRWLTTHCTEEPDNAFSSQETATPHLNIDQLEGNRHSHLPEHGSLTNSPSRWHL